MFVSKIGAMSGLLVRLAKLINLGKSTPLSTPVLNNLYLITTYSYGSDGGVGVLV